MNNSDLEWRTSRRSGAHSHCVQIAVAAEQAGVGDHRVLMMRDSKDTAGPVLAITPAEWKMFTRRIKDSLLSL